MKKIILVLICILSFGGVFANNDGAKELKDKPMDLTSFDTIRLLKPNTKGGKPLMKLFNERKSDRNFSKEGLSLRHLSELLWAANGINRKETNKRTVPSAMALYPIETYVFLENGVYLYCPHSHILIPVVKGDYREITGRQIFVNEAPLNIVYIANFNKYKSSRKDDINRWVYIAALDAGHSSQNVYLYCAQEKLKTVVRAGAQEEELMKLLNLDENYRFIVAQTVGH